MCFVKQYSLLKISETRNACFYKDRYEVLPGRVLRIIFLDGGVEGNYEVLTD